MVCQGIWTSSFSSSLTTPAGLTVVVIAILGVIDLIENISCLAEVWSRLRICEIGHWLTSKLTQLYVLFGKKLIEVPRISQMGESEVKGPSFHMKFEGNGFGGGQ
jgi:hypothetical protein